VAADIQSGSAAAKAKRRQERLHHIGARFSSWDRTRFSFKVPAQEQAELKAIVESTHADIVVVG
jgi:hypothetical protein